MSVVKFNYEIQGSFFQCEVDIDDWDELDAEDRLDVLREHALGEVDDVLSIDESSINDD